MHKELLDFFGPQERKLTVAGDEVAVRTLPDDADLDALRDPQDFQWKMLTRCTFYVSDGEGHKAGDLAFTDADIEVLKKAPRVRILPLMQALEAVNAFDLYAEVKNSGAVPSDG